jgi:hypothetical protein
MGSMLHHEERYATLDAKFEDAHDIGMLQVSDGASFGAELVYVIAR